MLAPDRCVFTWIQEGGEPAFLPLSGQGPIPYPSVPTQPETNSWVPCSFPHDLLPGRTGFQSGCTAAGTLSFGSVSGPSLMMDAKPRRDADSNRAKWCWTPFCVGFPLTSPSGTSRLNGLGNHRPTEMPTINHAVGVRSGSASRS